MTNAEKLYLGVAREIITPAIGTYLGGYGVEGRNAVSINDDLTVTALSFRYGDVRAMLISATIVVVDENICWQIRREIERETGIPAENIMFHATHTHSAPVSFTSMGWGEPDHEYVDGILIPKSILAAKRASASESYVRMGHGEGDSLVGVCRREPSRINNGVKLGCWKYGCFDPKMTVLSFVGEDGKCVANIVHYACHPTASGVNLEVTRDWPGVMIDRLEEFSGGMTAYFNGPEGDIGPRLDTGKTTGENHVKYALRHGELAARDAISIYKTIGEYRDVELRCAAREVKLPLEPRVPYEEAKRLMNPKADYAAYVERQKEYYAAIVDSYERGDEELEYREHLQTAVRIGDVAFVGHPFETFSEIGLRINLMSEIPTVLSLPIVNGVQCYLPTKGEIPRGGYEVKMFKTYGLQRYTEDTDFALINESLKTLEELK